MEASWNTYPKTGIQLIDEQHQELFRILGCLGAKARSGNERESIASLLEELVVSSEQHFASEETFMAQFGYPDFEPHVSEHASMLTALRDLLTEFRASHLAMIQMLPTFLEGWLKHHLSDGDLGFVTFLKSRNLT